MEHPNKKPEANDIGRLRRTGEEHTGLEAAAALARGLASLKSKHVAAARTQLTSAQLGPLEMFG